MNNEEYIDMTFLVYDNSKQVFIQKAVEYIENRYDNIEIKTNMIGIRYDSDIKALGFCLYDKELKMDIEFMIGFKVKSKMSKITGNFLELLGLRSMQNEIKLDKLDKDRIKELCSLSNSSAYDNNMLQISNEMPNFLGDNDFIDICILERINKRTNEITKKKLNEKYGKMNYEYDKGHNKGQFLQQITKQQHKIETYKEISSKPIFTSDQCMPCGGKCCSNKTILISKQEEKIIKKFAKKNKINVDIHNVPLENATAYIQKPIFSDILTVLNVPVLFFKGQCLFSNNKVGCVLRNDKPKICKSYVCDSLKNYGTYPKETT